MSESLVSGDFGESLVSFLLIKKGVDVVRASTKGFDLFAIDNTGQIFPQEKIVGISVKARFTNSEKPFSPTIPLQSKKFFESAKIWKIEPYVSIVVGNFEKLYLECYVLCLYDAKNYYSPKRKDAISVSQLRNSNEIKLL